MIELIVWGVAIWCGLGLFMGLCSFAHGVWLMCKATAALYGKDVE